MENKGSWVKLYHKLQDWEWFREPNMLVVFVHLLLKASYKPFKYKGAVYGRGVVITSREELSKETGLSERTIRTCLSRMKVTFEISLKTTKQGSVITLNNYERYQGENFGSDQPTTNERPTSDRQTTSYIEYRNNITLTPRACAREEFFNQFFEKSREASLEALCKNLGIEYEKLKTMAADVINEWELTARRPHRDFSDASQHLIATIRSRLKSERFTQKLKPNGTSEKKDRFSERRGTETAARTAEDYAQSF